MLELLQAVKSVIYFDIELMLRNMNEVIFILRKRSLSNEALILRICQKAKKFHMFSSLKGWT